MKALEHTECAYPGSLAEAVSLLADERTSGRLLCGGTDLMVQWESGLSPAPERVISLLGVPELHGIFENGDDIVIGAASTHARIRNSEIVRTFLPSLAASAATVGGAQIQARGTIGGNVANASPAGDLAPALMVAGGCVVVAGPNGERKSDLATFFRGYRKIDLHADELIVRFELPKLRPGCRELFRKLGPRAAQAISKVMGACRGHVENGNVTYLAVALGSVGPTVVRLPELETWIQGRALSGETIAEAERRASAEVRPIDDIRSTAAYRKWVSGRLVRWFLRTLAG